MICKKCSAEYDESLETCPGCALLAEGVKTESTVEEKEQVTVSDTDETDAVENEGGEESEISAAGEKSETEAETDDTAEETAQATAEETAEEENKESSPDEGVSLAAADAEKVQPVKKAAVPANGAPEQRRAPVRRPVRRGAPAGMPVKPTKKEKRVSAVVILLMCLVGILSVILAVVNITTDIFETGDNAGKVVAGVGFTMSEEKELESIVAGVFSAAKKEFDVESVDTKSFFERINPADKGNVYSRVTGAAEVLQTEADPALRFADEEGNYAYYKLSESNVDKVLSLFGLESYCAENSENLYYYDGYYYLAAPAVAESTPVVNAEITKSRRVLDGSYYVECYFYAENGGEVAKSANCYLVVELSKDEATDANVFIIRRITVDPIYGSDGTLLETSEGVKREKEVVEGETANGTLFCEYIIEYPVIDGETAGHRNAVDFFKNLISVYGSQAGNAEKNYKDYVAAGGAVSELPYKEVVVADVVFEDEKNISVIGDVSVISPEEVKKETEDPAEEADTSVEDETENEAVKLCGKKVEAYTFDKATGDFVSKDSVLGKEHSLVIEVLYRIYNGYDYSDLIPSEEEEDYYADYVYVPDDTEGTGMKIYESAWSLSQQGVTFYYVNAEGFVQQVTIPYDVVSKLAAKIS